MPRIDPADFKFQRAITEIRYPKAHSYWDDCGKLMHTIETRIPGLIGETVRPDGCQFSGNGVGATSASFFWDKSIVVQEEHDPATKFGATATEFWRLVAKELGIVKASRLGHRMWFVLPTTDGKPASDWLAERTLWEFGSKVSSRWGAPTSDGIVLRSNLSEENRSIRLEIGAAEIKTPERRPTQGIMLDVDITALDVRQALEDLGAFIRWNYRFVEQNRDTLFK